MNRTATTLSDWQIVLKAFLYGVAITAAGFIGALWLETFFVRFLPRHADDVRIALMMVILWVVLVASVRSIDQLKRGVEGWKLMVLGTGIATGAAVLFNLFRLVFPHLLWSAEMVLHQGFHWQSCLFFAAIGLVLSVIAVIRHRVNNKFWANILVLMVIVGVFLVLFYFAKD